MMTKILPRAAFALLACSSTFVRVASAQSLYNDPSTYFGGQDNDPYLNWIDRREEGAYNPGTSVFLPSVGGNGDEDGVAIHWKIKDDNLHVTVAARATGWVGFGISEGGGMAGSDVVLFKSSEPDKLVDGHIIDLSGPIEDECQHWELLSSSTTDGFLIFEAKRPINTFDNQDLLIRDDADSIIPPTRIISAWGDSDRVQYHGRNRATGAIRFFQEQDVVERVAFEHAMTLKSDGYFDIAAKDFQIPANDTLYQPFCMTWNDVLAANVPEVDGLTIVGFEPIIDEDARKHVHHFGLAGGPRPRNNDTCDAITEDTLDLAYVWAPGEPPFDLPDNVGIPIGPNGLYQSFKLEIHYDNPTLVEGVVDSSGVRVYYSTTPREHEMGLLETGDPWMGLLGQPVGEGLVEHSFFCGGGCSGSAISEPVTVLREHLHMHQSGVQMYHEQLRNGAVVRSGRVQFFDFDQQGNPAVQQQPFEILPGDEFKTVCHYKSGSEEKWGLSSQEEMCMTFLFYYPRQVFVGEEGQQFPWICSMDMPIPQCVVEHATRTLSSESELKRTFGLSSDQCHGTVQESASALDESSSLPGIGSAASILMTALATIAAICIL